MNFDEFTSAVEDAQRTVRFADKAISQLARLLVGRLRAADTPHWVLKDLKKELANYNMHTGEWK